MWCPVGVVLQDIFYVYVKLLKVTKINTFLFSFICDIIYGGGGEWKCMRAGILNLKKMPVILF